jgi:hypothetical protein
MNLYLLRQNVNNGYDTYDSAIVAATTEAEAKEIHPSIYSKDIIYSDDLSIYDWAYDWCTPKDVQVTYIGTAKPGTNKGVILSSFNAG